MTRTHGRQLILAVWFLLVLEAGHGANDIDVVGLFSGRAVVVIDGRQMVLEEGEVSPEGVKLIEADSESAKLEIGGMVREFSLSRRVGGEYSEPSPVSVSIMRNQVGQYVTMGSINRSPIRFLVDTGASVVAMNHETAKRLGVPYEESPKVTTVTAGGVIEAHRVFLSEVRVGEILVRNVETAVIVGEQPSTVLLGMSFLRRVRLSEQNGVLVLNSIL